MTGTLAPMASTVFDLHAKPDRAQTIEIINRQVNMSIVPDHRVIPLGEEVWSIGPVRGQCHDYVVTKQWHLAAHGIESYRCEVALPDGEHHLVLLVDGRVLDSLTPQVLPIDQVKGKRYRWVRWQSGEGWQAEP